MKKLYHNYEIENEFHTALCMLLECIILTMSYTFI